MAMKQTQTMPEIPLPYARNGQRSTEEPLGFFSARYIAVTSVAVGGSQLDAMRNGPIVLDDEAAERFRQVMASERRPLPAQPAARSDGIQAR